jgi:hypothetical protein
MAQLSPKDSIYEFREEKQMKEQLERKKIPPLYWVIIAVCAGIILISVFFLFQYGLIGEKVIITEYSFTTTYSTQECISESINVVTGEVTCIMWGPKYHSLPGLYKGLPSEAENIGYVVTFKVGNKAGKHLDVIGVKVIFCDANNNELCSELTSVYDIPNSYTKESSVTLYESDTSYFYNIEKVRFEIIID